MCVCVCCVSVLLERRTFHGLFLLGSFGLFCLVLHSLLTLWDCFGCMCSGKMGRREGKMKHGKRETTT